ncbi:MULTISPECIES: extracellular solute-binding protein [Microbacterium]|uniref:Extracellular solute-binding protein n=1 Tax=Microbacterium resistens TaxID=156977 RepID=A0ABY3RRH6_9MICO|nr:extracellular solute-binding protein [Microbacterium resistens]MBW1638323.1 extracellular solute-binding protein [Microbacterium resistens]MDA4893581.1 extracellular solute-binding protein [Streptomyces sp. MS2A]UGS25486.1 extracellular solute-binding protein [Microbacterium resistens]
MARRTMIAAAALAGALAMTACSGGGAGAGGGDGETGDLRVWFMQDSVSEDAVAWLEEEFAKENPGSTLTVEMQPWEDIVSRLQTSLASKTETPDIVEIGNTKTVTFASVGALADLTDVYEDLGGDELIPSFVDAATVDDKRYALPLYAGSSVLFYRTDLFQAAGIEVPKTLDELVAATQRIQAANPEGVEGFKGIYFPVVDTHGLEGWLFSNDANYAEKDGDAWVSALDTPEAKKALTQMQTIWSTSALGALDGKDTAGSPWVPYNDGEVAMFSYRVFAQASISDELKDVTGVMALPPAEAGGDSHQFLGGSNVAVSANSSNQPLAKKALELIMSEDFMSQLAEDSGWVPGNTAYADAIPDGLVPASLQQQIAETSRLTPTAPAWAIVEGNNIPVDLFSAIAKGEDIDAVVKRSGAKIEETLNAD